MNGYHETMRASYADCNLKRRFAKKGCGPRRNTQKAKKGKTVGRNDPFVYKVIFKRNERNKITEVLLRWPG